LADVGAWGAWKFTTANQSVVRPAIQEAAVSAVLNVASPVSIRTVPVAAPERHSTRSQLS
jgi:hypothetical protein